MADIYVKPNIQEVEKLRQCLGDAFLWHVVKGIIKSFDKKKHFQSCEALWFSLTRQMFKNYIAIEVYDKTEKALEEASDLQWFEHRYPRGFWNENWKYNPKRKSVIKLNLRKSEIKKLINDNIKITDVAKQYGIKVKNKKALCPFHEDKEPSLCFDNTRNIFHCFGCNAKGDIIEFERRMRKEDDRRKNNP